MRQMLNVWDCIMLRGLGLCPDGNEQNGYEERKRAKDPGSHQRDIASEIFYFHTI